MTVRPIIFSAPMILSLVGGRKTQTRRLASSSLLAKCQPGDRLWVREAWKYQHDPDIWMCIEYLADGARIKPIISDDNQGGRFEAMCDAIENGGKNPGRPSIHMPRWASRMTLMVTEVRFQRIQDISEADARAEGCDCLGRDAEGEWWHVPFVDGSGGHSGADSFRALWSHINGPGAWHDNPEIVALTFTVHHHNIDSPEDRHGR